MHSLLARFSVKIKIISAFVLVLSILVIVATFVVIESKKVESRITNVVDYALPLQRDVQKLKNHIDASVNHLGFYLLGKEKKDLEIYEDSVDEAFILLEDIKLSLNSDFLNSQSENSSLNESLQLLNEVSELVFKYIKHQKVLKKVATDDSFNMLGLKMTLDNLQPMGLQITRELSSMVAAEEEEEFDEDRKHVLPAINELRMLVLRLSGETRLFLAFRFPITIENIKTIKTRINELLIDFSNYSDNGELTLEQEVSVLKLIEIYANYFLVLEDIISIHSGKQWRKDTYLIRNDISPLIGEINTKIDAILELQSNELNKETTSVVKGVNASSYIVLIVSLVGVVIGVLAAWFITLHILKRMNTSVEALNHIAEGGGNLKTRLDESGKDEMSQLSSSFNKFVTKIGHIVDLVIQSSTSLSAEATRMLDVTTETQEGVVKQQTEIESISIAIKEMTNTVENIAHNSSQAADTALEATTEAQSGQVVVKQSVDTIHQLANEVERAVEVIKKVDKESEDIGIVVSVIRDISDQTNLLALNAAIEAARAGEHGRGFAVVADEVRGLSNKIQSQTSLIIERIETLQSGARDAVLVMTKGFETAKNSVSLSNQAGDALQTITDSVINISTMSASIAKSTEVQSKVANDILNNISVIGDIAEQTSQGANATKQSATEFRSMSAQLQGLVEQFLLDETTGVLDERTDGGVKIGENQEDEDIFF